MPTQGTRVTLDKIVQLDEATQNLTRSVGRLTDVVDRNNDEVNELREELKTKADYHEVKESAEKVREERKDLLKKVLAIIAISCFFSGAVAYSVADHQGQERCEVNAQNISSIVRLLESFPDPENRLQPTIRDLKSNRNDC